MADFSHVSPGDKSPAKSVAWLNAVSDAAAHFHNQVAGGVSKNAKQERGINPTTVKVQNTTGTDLLRGHVVQLGDFELDALDPRKIWFEGGLPADPVTRWLAIVRYAVKTGKRCDAQMLGVSTAIVNVSDVDHEYATAEAGSHILISATSGPVEILSPITNTGEQEVAVLLGGGGSTPVACDIRGTVTSTPDANNEFEIDVVEIYQGYSGSELTTATLYNVHNWTVEVGMIAWGKQHDTDDPLVDTYHCYQIDCPTE